jgi:hypothetical protein
MLKKIFFILTVFLIVNTVDAQQKMGFGCLGMVGGFGGYSYQEYNAEGLNRYIDVFNNNRSDSLTNGMGKFGVGTGYRVGINFFRASLKGLVITTKGFYQSASESHDAKLASNSREYSYLFEYNIQSWGLGFDIGASIAKPFVWKVIDASVLFNNSEFKRTDNLPEAVTIIDKYKDDSNLSYSIGTGFIFSVIQNYITLEGTVGYSIFSVKNLKNDDNKKMPVDENSTLEMDNFIKSGGMNFIVQLNLSFPI